MGYLSMTIPVCLLQIEKGHLSYEPTVPFAKEQQVVRKFEDQCKCNVLTLMYKSATGPLLEA